MASLAVLPPSEHSPFPELRHKAIINSGADGSSKYIEFLEAFGLPGGLLPLKDVIEAGYVEETGFVWILCKSKQQHHFKKVDRFCKYEELVTCKLVQNKLKDIKGVKVKDMLLWVNIIEIAKDDKDPPRLHFKSFLGISKSFPAEHFSREAEAEAAA